MREGFPGLPSPVSLSKIAPSIQPDRRYAWAMKIKVWTRPEVKEIHLGCEINSYAPAEI
jgi:coenzyme PQQ precursor peptide PqqA